MSPRPCEDGVAETGLFLVGFDLVHVAFEAKGIDGIEGGVQLFERIRIEQHFDTLLRSEHEVMITLRADRGGAASK